MALPLSNSFEGGSDGTTLTAGSGGNTGGGSGDFFDAVTIGVTSGTALIFDTTHVRGRLSLKTTTSANTNNAYATWSTSFGTQTLHWGRLYFYTAANPGALSTPVNFRTGANVLACRINLDTTGHFLLVNNANTTLKTFTTAIALNAWNRLEWKVDHTNGVFEAKLYKTDPDATSADETQTSSSGAALGTNCNEVDIGKTGSINTSVTWWFDDINLNAVGYPGPSWRPRGLPVLQAVGRATSW